MTSVSGGHIILTPTQPVGSGRPQWGSNPGPLHKESRAPPTELPRQLEKGRFRTSFHYGSAGMMQCRRGKGRQREQNDGQSCCMDRHRKDVFNFYNQR